MLHIPGLYIAEKEGKSRGVYTAEELRAGDLIEISPVIIIPADEVATIHDTRLHDYYFTWGVDMDQAAIALGYGSLYNHASTPNIDYELSFIDQTISFTAIMDIPAGTELTIDYEAGLKGQSQLWFEPVE